MFEELRQLWQGEDDMLLVAWVYEVMLCLYDMLEHVRHGLFQGYAMVV